MRRINPRASFGGEEYIVAAIDSGGDDDARVVESTANHVYFYADVSDENCLKLIKELRKIDQELIGERLERNLPPDFPHIPIWLHVSSYGGEVFSAFSIVDQIPQLTSKVYSIVEGKVASAATLLTMGCAKRYIQPNAYMLIHQLSGFLLGTHQEMVDGMELADMQMRQMVDFYVRHSEMDESKIAEIVKRDSWIPSRECVELGLADEIL